MMAGVIMRDIQYRGHNQAARGLSRRDKDPDQGYWFKSLLLVAAVLLTVANFGYQRSKSLEYAVVGRPSLGEMVQRDKTREQMMKDDHYRYNSYETHSDADRVALSEIIGGGE
jgi:hypothetical protein